MAKDETWLNERSCLGDEERGGSAGLMLGYFNAVKSLGSQIVGTASCFNALFGPFW